MSMMQSFSTTPKLLVRGYVRTFEQLNRQDVPPEIVALCTLYYYANTTLILLCNGVHANLYITDIVDREYQPNKHRKQTVWHSHLHAMPESHYLGYANKLPSASCTQFNGDVGLCAYSNVDLPNWISAAVNFHDQTNSNVIFKCGGSGANMSDCFAIILRENDFTAAKTEVQIKPYVWKLPPLQSGLHSNCVLYSKQYGLLSVGGCTADAYGKSSDGILQLSLTNSSSNSWCRIASLQRKAKHVTALMINDRTLWTGGAGRKDCAIYDFGLENWVPLRQGKYALSKMGAFFDKYEKKIYCIGGEESGFAVNKCTYFDLEMNEWFRLPNTHGKHGAYPAVWKHPNHKHVLMVASYMTNTIETYDLRMAETVQWTRIFDVGWNLHHSGLGFHIINRTHKSDGSQDRMLRLVDEYF